MKAAWKIGASLAALLALSACGRKEKGDKDGDDAGESKVDNQTDPAAGTTPGAANAPVSADAIKNDGSSFGLRSGEQYYAHLMYSAGLKPEDITTVARDEINRLIPTLPKSGGGIPTFTSGHLTNGAKIAFRVCDAWVNKAADGKDPRFAAGLPWKDGGPADKFLAISSLAPVFEAALWGTDAENHPSASDKQSILLSFNEGLSNDVANPATPNTMAGPPNFKNSAVANCVLFAISSPAWFF